MSAGTLFDSGTSPSFRPFRLHSRTQRNQGPGGQSPFDPLLTPDSLCGSCGDLLVNLPGRFDRYPWGENRPHFPWYSRSAFVRGTWRFAGRNRGIMLSAWGRSILIFRADHGQRAKPGRPWALSDPTNYRRENPRSSIARWARECGRTPLLLGLISTIQANRSPEPDRGVSSDFLSDLAKMGDLQRMPGSRCMHLFCPERAFGFQPRVKRSGTRGIGKIETRYAGLPFAGRDRGPGPRMVFYAENRAFLPFRYPGRRCALPRAMYRMPFQGKTFSREVQFGRSSPERHRFGMKPKSWVRTRKTGHTHVPESSQ